MKNTMMKNSGFKKKSYDEKIAVLRAQKDRQVSNVIKKKKTPQKSKSALKKPKKPSARQLKDKLWAECKRIIRIRHGNTCYTCGAQGLQGSNWQTGHFISSSICSVEMRYSLDNLRPQCMVCNIHRSGNWPAYEKHLIQEGIDVQELKDRNEKTKGKQYDSLWYLAKIEEYKSVDN